MYHVHDFRALDGNEVDSGLVGDGLGQKGFSASGRTAKENSGRNVQAELLHNLRTLNRNANRHLELSPDVIQCSDIVERNIWN